MTAIFLAAMNFAQGNLDAIYAAPATVFNLSAPPAWETQADAIGAVERPLYPFIYPPLWAWLIGPLTTAVSFSSFTTAAYVINPVLMGLSAILSYRVIRPNLALPVWVLLTLFFVTSTSFGYIALFQNQPQIFVSFLILLALERDRSGASLSAGAVLALAASIKLYPAVFAICWLATGNWRALGAFTGFGAVLGGASIAVAGWPLHADFLAQISTISGSILSCPFCLNVDSTLAHVALYDYLSTHPKLSEGGSVSSLVFAGKPAWISAIDKVLIILALVAVFRLARGADRTRMMRVVFPATILIVAMISPLTWSYHYLPVAFLVPVLIGAYRHGWMIFAGLAIWFNILLLARITAIPAAFHYGQMLGIIGIGVILALILAQPNQEEPY